ncbi:ketol-acid reductoisomerase, partial [Bacillus sp. D-CC]
FIHKVNNKFQFMYEGGLENMRYSVSDTAQWGDFVSGPRVVTEDTKKAMGTVLAEIQDGTFARGWIAEHKAGRPNFHATNEKENEHEIEVVGRKLREMMPFVQPRVKVGMK